MRKGMKAVLSALMVFSLIGCSQKQDVSAKPEETKETVEVDEGLLNVTVTLPASFFEMMGTTSEDYVAEMKEDQGDKLKDVKINDDKSVELTMSKKNYNEMMDNMTKSIDESIQKMVDDQETYPNITAVTVNKDYTEYTVTLESGELGFNESFSVLNFYIWGGLYQAFAGNGGTPIIVNFVDKDGNLIQTADSSQMTSE